MIGYLEGKIVYFADQNIIVNVCGVGYKVFIGSQSFTLDQSVKLFVYTNVSERDISLIGFQDEKQLELFHLLLGVSGVGPKIAHKFVSTLGVQRILEAIASGNDKELKTSGVGPKTASKIVLELKDKVVKRFPNISTDSTYNQLDSTLLNQAKEGLAGLGYNSKEIEAALNSLDYNATINDAQTLLKMLLRHIK